jgi:hypothetical protein
VYPVLIVEPLMWETGWRGLVASGGVILGCSLVGVVGMVVVIAFARLVVVLFDMLLFGIIISDTEVWDGCFGGILAVVVVVVVVL